MVLDVTLRVGNTLKTIRVIGDRRWNYSSRLLPEHFSRPQPFTVMELTLERAFGGIDPEGAGFCAENPFGRGFIAKKSRQSLDGASLPNLEDPQHLIRSWNDHPRPVGFGVSSRSALPRSAFLGTYDEKWRLERSPAPPEDFRFDYYNAAFPDLQVAGYLTGDEEIELVHLSPVARLSFRLPGLRPGCRLTLAGTPPTCENLTLNLDTLCLMPEECALCLVWRGTCPISDLSAREVESIHVRTG